ncbi:MAG: ribonuclease P protein component [Cytophagales bacterium]|jgi:ribonuclease P protein component|nr:ribonuclease P protein component [Cytophagales bacterium]
MTQDPRPRTLSPNRNLRKAERLHSKKLIEELFAKGSSVYLYPFRLQFLPRPAQPDGAVPVAYPQILFSVSKRNFKRANRRNLIRRRLREIYRLHKHQLLVGLPPHQLPLCFAVLYTSREVLPSDVLTRKFKAVWQKWRDETSRSSGSETV